MTTELRALDMTMPVGSFDAYFQRIQTLPMLTEEEEHELAVRWYEEQDLEAARKLVMSHLRYVAKIARGYSGYGLSVADLVQEGNVGLMKAVKRFNPYMGVRLVSFAVHWIKAEMHEFILKNWRIVKVATTKAQRKLFFNLRKAKSRLGWFTQDEVQSVADDLGVSTEEVLRMEQRLNAHDAAFDAFGADDDDSSNFAPSQYLADEAADPALLVENSDTSDHNNNNLERALTILDERSLDIVKSRWLAEKKATLHDLAAKYKVSAERIRQIEETAMKKMRSIIGT